MSKFTIFAGRNGQFYFNLKAGNGEIIGQSEGYTTKQSAHSGIDSCKRHAPNIDNYSLFQGRNSQYYWHLKAANGQVILQSEGYTAVASARNGIASCMKNVPIAKV